MNTGKTIHPLRRAFMPLYRCAHWPQSDEYQHRQRVTGVDRLFEQLRLDEEDIHTVVEVGCGDGYLSHRFAERFGRVIGFDYNPHRIGKVTDDNVLLVAGDAEQAPVRSGAADLVFSHSVLEHLPDRITALHGLTRLLRPGGWMVHVIPAAPWKVLQWAGFWPDRLRKDLRGVSRSLAGQRKEKRGKFHVGMETNNPKRMRRKGVLRHFVPRVHGEYASNLDEFRKWRLGWWRHEFESAGLKVRRVIPLDMSSPYGFGVSQWMRRPPPAALATMVAFIAQTEADA